MTARRCGLPEILSFDMGGTTAKLCLIDNSKPQTTRAFEIARAARFIKGSGMPARIPVMDMIEIGAGGGSIATVDRLGRILVGPQSAGSDPGPAAFGKGGQEATVTDADAVSGYLDPERFAEGRLSLDIQTAQRALTRSVADADDLVQEACIRALTRADQWDRSQPLDRWMFRITRNHWISELRKREVRLGQGHVPAEESNELRAVDTPEAVMASRDVASSIAALPPELSSVLLTVSVEGYSYAEAAELFDIPVGTVMSRIHRARKALAAQIEATQEVAP